MWEEVGGVLKGVGQGIVEVAKARLDKKIKEIEKIGKAFTKGYGKGKKKGALGQGSDATGRQMGTGQGSAGESYMDVWGGIG